LRRSIFLHFLSEVKLDPLNEHFAYFIVTVSRKAYKLVTGAPNNNNNNKLYLHDFKFVTTVAKAYNLLSNKKRTYIKLVTLIAFCYVNQNKMR